jgi:hypothetical protein
MRIADDYSSRGAPGVSMRTWLYLGAALLGLAMMGLVDRNAEETYVDEAVIDQPEVTSAKRSAASSSFAASDAQVVTQDRSIKLEAVGRVTVR